MSTVPKKIFVVPYRNRPQHKFFLSKYLTFLLEDESPSDYAIYFSHQCDDRPFNRGATKNIGFLAMKKKYPNDYKNITFIFNDVDTMPFNKIFNYDTTLGTVQHLYGFLYALGGIVIFKGEDFERINGYPNFWGWGMEDNVLQKRCLSNGLMIDRSQFYKIGDLNILQLFDGIKRVITRKEQERSVYDNGVEGLTTIYGLSYSIDLVSTNDQDNTPMFTFEHPNIFFINIHTFQTLNPFVPSELRTYDLRDKQDIIYKKTDNQNAVQMNIGRKQVSASVNIFSPNYAKDNKVKARASPSARINMYGIQK
jgi:hypothetical protein